MLSKKLAGKYQQTDKPVKDKNKNVLTTTGEQIKRWAEHFQEILNRPVPEETPDISPADSELPINCDAPSKAEIRKAITSLRNGKTAGPDSIPAEALKAGKETSVDMLHALVTKIWEKEDVPEQWKEGLVIKIPKKGDLNECDNYRGIMLLWRLMKHYGIPEKIISIVQSIYQGMFCRVVHFGQISEGFEVKTGVRQGCLLSPFLFLLVIDWIMKTVTSNRNNGIQWTLLTQLDDLDFADDLALLSHNKKQMQNKTDLLKVVSEKTGLKINKGKTEVMKINTSVTTPITVVGEHVKEVENFCIPWQRS